MNKHSIPPESDNVILVGRCTSPGFTKRIELGADGRLIKTPPIWRDGRYETLRLGSLADWHAELLLGTAGAFYTSGVAAVDAARCMTKRTVEGDAIFRGGEHIKPTPGKGLVVFDHDGGMTPKEFDTAMIKVIPNWMDIGIVRSMSTSACITRDDGTIPDGVNAGHHTWLVVASQDFKLLQSIIMTRAWNAGYGDIHLSGDGRMQARCLVDMAPLHPVQPVFESGAKLGPGLQQKRPAPGYREGAVLDISSLPPLTEDEIAECAASQAEARAALQAEADARRAAWRDAATARMAARPGISRGRARATVEAATKARGKLSGTLGPAWLLYPDEGDAVAVASVLASPGDFHRITLADPLDGEGSDPGKAMIFVNASGDVMIHSFAHGGGVWQLVQDVDGLLEAVDAAVDGWDSEWSSPPGVVHPLG